MNRDEVLAIAIIGLAVVATMAAGSLAAVSAAEDYGALEQPAWAPPSWLFGPVWSTLYILIAISGILVWWQQRSFKTPEMALYGGQLVVNALWTPLFFAWELRGLALAWILLLDVLVIVTMVRFWPVRRLAAGLLAPYLLWICFATALNAAVWSLNR